MSPLYWERHPDGPFVTLIAVAATYLNPENYEPDSLRASPSARTTSRRSGHNQAITVTAILRDLRATGAVEFVPPAEPSAPGRGRRAEGIRLAARLGLIGRTLAGIVNVLAPDAIVVGGDLEVAGAPFVGALERAVRQNVRASVASALSVRLSTFGTRSEIVGAVYLAAELAGLG